MQSKEKKNITPMIIMTPKSLLRHPFAASPVEEFTNNDFSKIIEYEPENKNNVHNKIISYSCSLGYPRVCKCPTNTVKSLIYVRH